MIPVGARTATIVDDAGFDAIARAVLRDRLPPLTPYRLLDRGRYDMAVLEPRSFVDVLTALVPLARSAAPDRAAPELVDLRAIRFRAGDYALAHHDVRGTTAEHADQFPLELVLDLSPRSAAGELHYRRRGHVFFRVPCAPGSLAIVERSPAVTSNQTYVSLREPAAEILRIVALMV